MKVIKRKYLENLISIIGTPDNKTISIIPDAIRRKIEQMKMEQPYEQYVIKTICKDNLISQILKELKENNDESKTLEGVKAQAYYDVPIQEIQFGRNGTEKL